MNSGRQACGPFYAYVGWGSLLILMIGKLLVPSLDFWLLQMVPPSAVYGERCYSCWVFHSKSSMWC